VDASTNSVITSIVTTGKERGIAFVPDGSVAFVTSDDSDLVSQIDTATFTITAEIAVGDLPYYPAMSPDGSRLFVPNFGSASVSVIATGWVQASTGGDPAQYPRVPPQEFALPDDLPVAECARLVPEHVDWPGLAGLAGDGWTRSWARWPNGGTGGFVCSRQPYWTGSRWAV
jgi:YVTN family beta-propeller protein